MGIITDFQNLKQAVERYAKNPTDHNADLLRLVKDTLHEYGEEEVERQAHQIFTTLQM